MVKIYVLTGGPGSGKSSILLALEQRGEAVIREAAEDYIKLRQAQGVAEPWKEPDFQQKIMELQMQREKDAEKIAKNRRVWLDRGLIDGLAYLQLQGKSLNGRTASRIIKQAKPYKLIFLIENLGHCDKNKVRRENQEEALQLEKMQEQNYYYAGYDPVRIAPGPLERRVQDVLEWARQHEQYRKTG
jgi:predicted ATPase